MARRRNSITLISPKPDRYSRPNLFQSLQFRSLDSHGVSRLETYTAFQRKSSRQMEKTARFAYIYQKVGKQVFRVR